MNETAKSYDDSRLLKAVWPRLTPEDEQDYWKHILAWIDDDRARMAFSQMIGDLEAGPIKSRGPAALPPKRRKLAVEDLRRGIARFKERLFEVAERGGKFLTFSLQTVVRSRYLDELLSILDEFGVPHDAEGIPEKGFTFQAPEPDQLQARLISLNAKIPSQRLSIVLCALSCDSPSWNFLRQQAVLMAETLPYDASKPGSNGAGEQTVPGTDTQNDGNTPPKDIQTVTAEGRLIERASAQAPSDTPMRIEALQLSFANLQVDANRLALQLAEGVLPDTGDFGDRLHRACEEFRNLARVSDPPETSLAGIAAAFSNRRAKEPMRALLLRALTIRNTHDPEFPGCQRIREACERSLNLLESRLLTIEELDPFKALEVLVDQPDTLSPDEEDAYDMKLKLAFGSEVMRAATRKRLAFVETLGEGSPKEFTTADEPEAGPNETSSRIQAIDDSALPEVEEPECDSIGEATEASVSNQHTDDTLTELIDNAVPGAKDPCTLGSQGFEAAPLPELSPTSPTPNSTSSRRLRHDVLLQDEYEISEVVHHVPIAEPERHQADIAETAGLLDFKSFNSRYWIAPSGETASAPWRESDYAARLLAAGDRALAQHEFALSLLFFLAAESFGASPTVATADLKTIAEILENGQTAEGLSDQLRAQRLLSSYANQNQGPGMRSMLFLEGLSPHISSALNAADLKRMCEFAQFQDRDLGRLVLGMLQMRAAGGDVIATLRTTAETERPADPRELERNLERYRTQLRAEVSNMWSAAGGQLARTHCREAWKRFMDQEVAPLRDDLLPPNYTLGYYKQWNIRGLEARHRQFLPNYRSIADAGSIGNADRKKADKAAARLAELFGSVIQTASHLLRRTSHQKSGFEKLSPDALHGILTIEHFTDPIEEMCRLALRAICDNNSKRTSPMRLPATYLLACPDLLRFLPAPPADLIALAGRGVSVVELTDATRAAAYALLAEPAMRQVKPAEFGDTLRQLIQDRQRPDLLAILAQSGKIDSALKTRLHREADSIGASAFFASENLRSLWRDCEALIAPESHVVKVIAEEARALTSDRAHLQGMGATMLARTWIESVISHVAGIKARAIDGYETLIRTRFPDRMGAFELARNTGELRSIPPLTREEGGEFGRGGPGGARRTIWRSAAERFFENPAHYLNSKHGSLDEVGKGLLDLWLTKNYSAQHEHNRKLRHRFYFFISGDPGSDEKARKKASYPRELRNLEQQRVTIDSQQIRKIFNKSRVNPTFLPQLKDFRNIVIASAPAIRSGSSTATWVRSVVDQNDSNSLLVILAPGLSATLRAEVLGQLRQRKICAALIDDIDICRLVAMDDPAGHDFVPFLEIILEQLSLDLHNISPFSPVDGQNTPMEMFVGRQEMAEALAFKAEITRVFSGRKLGKSAMLKHIEVKYDGAELPSGMKLNVLFISVPGIDSELTMVGRIIDELRRRFAVEEVVDNPSRRPADRFADYVREILNARPKDSILIILDEADTFIEAQLIDQQERPEATLSFRMMKELPSTVDKRGIPRARVVFSGYRKTNTRDGVWANAGDILTLKPLQPQEAISFVEGALARIGINAGSLSEYIASRCGFQPAVLIRFGASLLARLQRTRSASERDSISITEEDVVETFNDTAVQSEIRTVVNNNFHSNPAGQAIFSATLLAMKDLAPGYMLENGAQQVLDKLLEIEGSLEWLYRIDPDPKAEVERNLQDFIDRELLESDDIRFGDRTYRLRFTHFLPVLTQHSELPIQIRQSIASLRNAPEARGVGGSVLARSALEAVRHWYAATAVDYCRLCVVAGPWLEAFFSDKVGIANRLGLSGEAIVDCNQNTQFSARLKAGLRFFNDPSLAQCEELHMRRWDRPAVVVGGMEVLRRFTELQESQFDIPIEVIGMRRLTPAVVGWWFETVRALHFESGNAVARLMNTTFGSPYLVMRLDQLFKQEGGSDVSSKDLDLILSEFASNEAEAIRDLTFKGYLSAREWELLQMIGGLASLDLGNFEINGSFSENWEVGADSLRSIAHFAAPYSNSEDPIALRVLQLSGMIEVRESSRGKRMVDEPIDGFAARVFRHAGG
jgi:hypothetical protein